MSEKEKSKKLDDEPKIVVNDRRHWVDADDDAPIKDENLDERYPSVVEKLKQESEEKDKRLREYIAAYKTKSAKNDEFRIRLQKENDSRLEQIKANFFQKLIPIVNNLKRATDSTNSSNDFENLKQGIVMTHTQFMQELKDQGVSTIEAKGRQFDPKTDEVFLTVETEDPAQDNIVIEEFEPGFKAVKVKVAKLKNS
jgi:molecular chaperone GrpE